MEAGCRFYLRGAISQQRPYLWRRLQNRCQAPDFADAALLHSDRRFAGSLDRCENRAMIRPAEKDTIKGQLRAQQDAMRPNIRTLGGTVLGSYQSAVNGIKVRISRGQLASLASLPGVVAVRPVQLHYPDNLHGVPLVGGPAV